MGDQNIKVPQDILIWDSDIGFIQILEGDGSNLHQDDIDNGYTDYMLVLFLDRRNKKFVEIDGFQAMLTELYQKQFTTPKDVVNYLIMSKIIPDEDYKIIHAD